MSIMKDTHGSAMTDEPRTSNSDASHATAQARPPMTDEEWMEEFQRGSADGALLCVRSGARAAGQQGRQGQRRE